MAEFITIAVILVSRLFAYTLISVVDMVRDYLIQIFIVGVVCRRSHFS